MGNIIVQKFIGNIALFASNKIVNNGNSILDGDIALIGTTLKGFPPGKINGKRHIHNNFVTACIIYIQLYYRLGVQNGYSTSNIIPYDADITGYKFTVGTGSINNINASPNVYYFTQNVILNGSIYIDGLNQEKTLQGQIIFVISLDFISSQSNIILLNGALSSNIFWIISNNVQIGSNSQFHGTIIAHRDIYVSPNTKIDGSLWSLAGSIIINNNNITSIQKLIDKGK